MKFQGSDQYVATQDLMLAVNAAVTLQRPLRVNAGTRINLPDHGDTGLRLIAE